MNDGMLHIDINIGTPVSRKDLISDIRELQSGSKKGKKKRSDIPVDDDFRLGSLPEKKKKKKDKPKKKKTDTEFVAFGTLGENLDDVEIDEEDGDSRLIDFDSMFDREEDDLEDSIISSERGKYSKRKQDENPFKKEFAEEMTLLYNVYDEVKVFAKDIEKRYKATTNAASRVRGANKYAGDLTEAMLNTLKMKADITKDIIFLKKTQAELNFKREAKENKSSESLSSDAIATRYMQQILSHGRNEFIQGMSNRGGASSAGDDHDSELDSVIAEFEERKQGYTSYEMDVYGDMIDERLENEDNPMRSPNGTKYIQYENEKPRIVIRRCVDTNEWEFVALNKDNQLLPDYPLPNRADCGNITFSDTDNHAKDERGRGYDVIDFFSEDL